MGSGLVTGHDFSRAEKALQKISGFTGFEKTPFLAALKGLGFSRAVTTALE
jgi:hypothetical protein